MQSAVSRSRAACFFFAKAGELDLKHESASIIVVNEPFKHGTGNVYLQFQTRDIIVLIFPPDSSLPLNA